MIPAWVFPQPGPTRYVRGLSRLHSPGAKEEKDRWNLGFFCMGNGITVCNRVGVGSEWPMVAHIRYNREVNLYCRVPDTELERIRHMAATTEHIDNGELYSPETTPPIEPQEVVVIKNY